MPDFLYLLPGVLIVLFVYHRVEVAGLKRVLAAHDSILINLASEQKAAPPSKELVKVWNQKRAELDEGSPKWLLYDAKIQEHNFLNKS